MLGDSVSSAKADIKFAAPRSLYFVIFAISGFSGLIYESIWSHYLKLFLGHAAYAQSLVLIIFMGGMAAGSWIASRISRRNKLPILAYAVIEGIIGIVALVFHNVFSGVIEVFYAELLPAIGSPALGATLKWLASSLLIMPQSILLGMTFPLMSAGIIRRFPDSPGGSIAMLYFTNSIGASLGVLASGFWLINAVGLPGTILTAGLINIALALTVWVLVRLDPAPETEPLAITAQTSSRNTLRTLFLIAAFITGAASFIYEISWIRMLSLVLGATTHSFELMLSAFIMGLAFGGLWIKRRIDKISDPVRFSGFVQLIMGVMALLTIPIYMSSFDWMSWVIGALQKTDGGFAAFSAASHLIALGIMLPTTFMAGMTLPLFTHVLIQKGDGESSIGRIYAANTIGAIVGVLFAVHIGFSFLGLKNLIIFGAGLDIALAVLLLQRADTAAAEKRRTARIAAATLIGVGAIALTAGMVDFEKHLLVSGVYRHGGSDVAINDELLYYSDGKTASVSLRRVGSGSLSLATNGKVDAAMQMDLAEPATEDEITMTLLAALPLAYNPDATHVANIGLGSGMTTHVLLGNPRIEAVDTIEIEIEMKKASREFGAKVARAHEDPRSHIHIEDAKTYFSLHNRVYDIIVAEPSNPWVSGVASLFSTEFYGSMPQYLAEDGIFVQWIQLYEFSDALLESILKALAENFDDFVVYSTNSGDVVLIAKKNGALGEADWSLLREGNLQESLQRVEINSIADLQIRKIAERRNLDFYLELVGTPTNSDYYPYVDLNAGRARYMGSFAMAFSEWMDVQLPLLEMLHGKTIALSEVTTTSHLDRNVVITIARWLDEKMLGTTLDDPVLDKDLGLDRLGYLADWVKLSQVDCLQDTNTRRWRDAVFELAKVALPNLEAERATAFVDRMYAGDCESTGREDARYWHELYTSIANRDAASMSAVAGRLLARNIDLDAPRSDYLLMAAMLGDISNGKALDAHKTWELHGASRYKGNTLPAPLKLLVSLGVRGATQAGSTN